MEMTPEGKERGWGSWLSVGIKTGCWMIPGALALVALGAQTGEVGSEVIGAIFYVLFYPALNWWDDIASWIKLPIERGDGFWVGLGIAFFQYVLIGFLVAMAMDLYSRKRLGK